MEETALSTFQKEYGGERVKCLFSKFVSNCNESSFQITYKVIVDKSFKSNI